MIKALIIILMLCMSFFAFGFGSDVGMKENANVGFIGWLMLFSLAFTVVVLL